MLRISGRISLAWGLCLVALVAGGCAGSQPKPNSNSTDSQSTYAKAEAYMAARQYNKALDRFQMVNAPDREMRAQVHLRMADAYFEKKGVLDIAEAQGRYLSFLNAFPLSDQASYAQYRFAQCLQTQINKPERDQSATRRVMGEFRKVGELYPNSAWVDEAALELQALNDHLSVDALLKARFYYKRKRFNAAEGRLRDILIDNPDWSERSEVMFLLGNSMRIRGQVKDGQSILRQLISESPESEWGRKAHKILAKADALSEQPATAGTG
jgi:outer membrane assembly lipoprotein YfiO